MECSRLRGYAARRAREEHELDLLRGRAAEAALGSGGGVGGTDTGAEDGTSKPSTGGQKVVLRGRVGNQGHGRRIMTVPAQESRRKTRPTSCGSTIRISQKCLLSI